MSGGRLTRRLSPRRRASAAVLAAALTAAVLASCVGNEHEVVRVRVTFDAPTAAAPLTELTGITGGDKYYWNALPAGTTKAFNLLPGAGVERQLLLSYSLAGAPRHWDGPPLAADGGYLIAVRIDRQGETSERHCRLPCALD